MLISLHSSASRSALRMVSVVLNNGLRRLWESSNGGRRRALFYPPLSHFPAAEKPVLTGEQARVLARAVQPPVPPFHLLIAPWRAGVFVSEASPWPGPSFGTRPRRRRLGRSRHFPSPVTFRLFLSAPPPSPPVGPPWSLGPGGQGGGLFALSLSEPEGRWCVSITPLPPISPVLTALKRSAACFGPRRSPPPPHHSGQPISKDLRRVEGPRSGDRSKRPLRSFLSSNCSAGPPSLPIAQCCQPLGGRQSARGDPIPS